MSGDWCHTAGLWVLILGAILGAVRWRQHRETTQILAAMERRTTALLAHMVTEASAHDRDRRGGLAGEEDAP
jgi:hypothetical protein